MDTASAIEQPTRLKGKYIASFVCWFLGMGSVVSWNTILTIGDYYYAIFPHYHPSRVITIVYQPFALATIAFLAYNEAKLNTRKRNIFGYILFFLGTLALLLVDLGTSGHGGLGNFIGICIIIATFGVASAQVQGGMIGDLSFMCPEFIQSFMAGLAFSGVLSSGLRLMAKAAFEKASDGLHKGARTRTKCLG